MGGGDVTDIDQGHAAPRWEFDEEVTRVFDNMLERSIPDYDRMRDQVTKLATAFVKHGFWSIDLGASRGESTARLIDRVGAALKYACVEASPPMVEALRARFPPDPAGYGYTVDVMDMDLRKKFPARPACLVLSVLCLCFVPIEHRQKVVRNAFNALLPGGGMIVVEKVLGDTADLDALFVDAYNDHKRSMGYSSEDIDRKRMSLEGVLVPVTARWNVELLRQAGFKQVDCFWRAHNFAGWVAIKGE